MEGMLDDMAKERNGWFMFVRENHPCLQQITVNFSEPVVYLG
jgi:hypothetical protein